LAEKEKKRKEEFTVQETKLRENFQRELNAVQTKLATSETSEAEKIAKIKLEKDIIELQIRQEREARENEKIALDNERKLKEKMKKEYEEELQRMKNIVEKRLDSEEKAKRENEKEKEKKHEMEKEELKKQVDLLQKEQQRKMDLLAKANEEEKAKLSKELNEMKETLTNKNNEQKMQEALDSLRANIQKENAERDAQKNAAEVDFHTQLSASESKLKAAESGLLALQMELEKKSEIERRRLADVANSDGKREEELKKLSVENAAMQKKFQDELMKMSVAQKSAEEKNNMEEKERAKARNELEKQMAKLEGDLQKERERGEKAQELLKSLEEQRKKEVEMN